MILPEYGVKNLASHVMAMCLKGVSADWERSYHIKPALVETFVDKERYLGTCYKAGNWILLGETKGRSRNDRFHENKFSKKYIYVYELEKGWLCPAPKKDEKEVEVKEEDWVTEDWVEEDWVTEELQGTKLSNKAKKKRLITLTRDFFNKPASPLPLVCEGEAKLKGAYRFFADDQVKPEEILNSHLKQTIERAKKEKVVLSVNDTTSFNLSGHKATKEIGYLSSAQNQIGYLLHDTVLFTTNGVPLGVLGGQTWARDIKEYGKKKERKNKPIEEKESYKWLKSLQATARAQETAPDVQFISVGDREADVYELFELAKKQELSFLVRSSQNRRTTEDIKVWDLIGKEGITGVMLVQVQDKNKKPREAELEIRYRKVRLVAPQGKKDKGEIELWAIRAKEINPPKGEAGLDWKLFTNIEIGNFTEACEKVKWYTTRFKIETFHRILKSGRRSEDKRLQTFGRLERCLAIDMITAWRLMYLTMSGRETPDIESNLFFNKHEIEVLKQIKYGKNYNGKQTLSLKEATKTIANLGGYISGKNRVPGVEVMWRGLRRLEDMILGALLMKRCLSDKAWRDNLDYG
ncbi:MAG: IS4 family transposase [Candidatus Omnitrophica bacterium]|nr:IS4 family transposase [Candidatus Omnitrophota bacterium]